MAPNSSLPRPSPRKLQFSTPSLIKPLLSIAVAGWTESTLSLEKFWRATTSLRRWRTYQKAVETSPPRLSRSRSLESWTCRKKVPTRSYRSASSSQSCCIPSIKSGIADVSIFRHKEIIGSALLADPNDNLDVTPTGETKTEKSSAVADAAVTPSTESPGLSLLTKLIFFGVIVGVIFSFFKTRKGSAPEKSLA